MTRPNDDRARKMMENPVEYAQESRRRRLAQARQDLIRERSLVREQRKKKLPKWLRWLA